MPKGEDSSARGIQAMIRHMTAWLREQAKALWRVCEESFAGHHPTAPLTPSLLPLLIGSGYGYAGI